MYAPNVAGHVNRLPWETWLDESQLSRLTALPPDELAKVLRAGRRRGSITVRRTDSGLQYKRVRLHPQPSQRLHVALS
ncbi:hypothetical protein AB0G49_14120 [Streptomyces longwoodensis]|uniref:hypothetical protein n=1 Tax=Streptomyces longwoodensis TaxID=68231 RepID=UPI0033E3B24C